MPRPSSAGARVAALTALALWAAPALAQAPAGKAPAAARAAAKPAAPPVHVWWNDPDVGASLSLTAEQRAKMDAIFAKHPQSAPPGALGIAKGRNAYFAALREGDMEAARKHLASWAEEEGASLRTSGEMRIELLSVMTADQRQRLGKMSPGIVATPWVARVSWRPGPPPPPPGAKPGPQAKPMPAPAAKPPAAAPAAKPAGE